MKKLLCLLFLFGNFCVYAQNSKAEVVIAYIPSYPEEQTPKGIKTYGAYFTNTENSVLPFSEQEFQSSLNFQDFTLATSDNPDLFFGINGVSADDLNLTISRNKAAETFSVSILPSERNSKIAVITMVRGVNTHYTEFPIYAERDENQKPIPTIIDFPFKEKEKYLIFSGEDNAKGTSYLVEEYLKRLLGDDYLATTIVPKLYKKYDLRVKESAKKFYFIKDKKNKALQEETKEKLASFRETIFNLKTLDKLRAGKELLTPYIDYWKNKLSNCDLSDKTGKKIGWGMLMNLHRASLLIEDFTSAEEYMNQMLELGERKLVTKLARGTLRRQKKEYTRNFDATGKRIYADAYEVDPIIQRIENNETVSNNDITKASGYIINEKGEKIEGKISIRFSPEPESQTGGNIVSLDGDTTAKRVTVTYVNEKGKTKNSYYKCKDVKEIHADDRIFESVNPKIPLSVSLNNTIFMERVHKTDKVILYKDLTTADDFYFKIKTEKKAQKASSNFFASCSTLAKRIESNEFSNSKEDQIKIADIYTSECN